MRNLLIDDFATDDLLSRLGTNWRSVTDRVMGGLSEADLTRDVIDGRPCLRLTGEVSLANNGGFVQAALDVAPQGETFDASAYAGLRLDVRGNDESYALHLRTGDCVRPWQSYRAPFTASPRWRTVELLFAALAPHRLEAPFDPARLRRLGLVAVGRAFRADLAVARISFVR